MRRLRGDAVGARAAYDRTRDLGVTPQPGEALLDEAEGRGGQALTGLLAALAEEGRIGRARLLLPVVEVALRAGDVAAAEALVRRARGDRRAATTPPACEPGPTTRPRASCSTAVRGMPP